MATLQDVAKRAGVSTGTVSNVLNNSAGVSDETRDKVLAAVKALNYRPNLIARSLASRKSRTVGLVVADIAKDLYPPGAKGVQEVLDQHGYTMVLFNSEYRTERELACIENVKNGLLDGLIFMSSSKQTDTAHLVAAREAGVPLVTINRPVPAGSIDQIRFDTAGGVARAVQHLVDLGHAHVGLISGPAGSLEHPTPWYHRVVGYRYGMVAAGLPADPAWMIEKPEGSYDTGFVTMQELLRNRRAGMPTAWVVANDILALGAINAARSLGTEVPGELAIIGVGGIPAGAYHLPGLTTVRLPMYEAGRQAAEILVRRLTNPESPTERQTLTCDLLVRGSCGARQSVPV